MTRHNKTRHSTRRRQKYDYNADLSLLMTKSLLFEPPRVRCSVRYNLSSRREWLHPLRQYCSFHASCIERSIERTTLSLHRIQLRRSQDTEKVIHLVTHIKSSHLCPTVEAMDRVVHLVVSILWNSISLFVVVLLIVVVAHSGCC